MQQIPDLFQEGEETWYEFTRDLRSNRTLESDSQKDWRTYVDSFVEKCSHIAFCKIYTGFHLLRHTYISFGISCNCHTYTRTCTHRACHTSYTSFWEISDEHIHKTLYACRNTYFRLLYILQIYCVYVHACRNTIYIYKIQKIYIYMYLCTCKKSLSLPNNRNICG